MVAATAAAALTALVIVTQDRTALRAAPNAAAATHGQLWQGEVLEVRGTRLDHLQVYDYKRERAGYVRASQVRVVAEGEAQAPELKSVMRFLRDTPGSEALGMAYVAAYLKSAPAETIDAEPFDALGVMAERLAQRASSSAAPSTATSAHMEVVAQYGVKFASYETRTGMRICYDGEAFQRVVWMGAGRSTPDQRARAVLALTRHDCIDGAMHPGDRHAYDRWRAELLDGLSPAETARLDEMTKNRLRMRRAGVWSALAFSQSRRGEPSRPAAERAVAELAAVNKSELGDEESADYQDAAVRVGAVRWAAAPPAAGLPPLRVQPGEPGQTCVVVAGTDKAAAATQRCTWGSVFPASARQSPDGRVITLGVQAMEGWTELWIWRRQAEGWTISVLPPTTATPALGYAELAGFVPGNCKLLVAREARIENRHVRRFELLDIETMTVEKSGSSSQQVAGFGQWADPAWKRGTLALR